MTPARGERVAAVRERVTDALNQLNELRCADPAAAPAMHTVKLTAQTLACWWLPLLDRALERAADH